MEYLEQESLIGLLACAMESDGKRLDAEKSYLEHVCYFHSFTKNMDPNKYNQAVKKVQSSISKNGWENSVKQFAMNISKSNQKTALLLVIDLCLVDGQFDKTEMKFVKSIADFYTIDHENLMKYCKIFMDKNGIKYSNNQS